ncbi:MAG TPA: alpha-amylase family glycosyl hydrolase, partial [Chloroflexia bacterium]
MTLRSYFQPSFLLLFIRRWGLFSLALLALGAIVLSIGTAQSLASPSADPTSVTIAGSFQDEVGCPGEWQPACATTHLTYDATDDVWQGSWTIPGSNSAYAYKAALNDSWTENYGRYAVPGGADIPLTVTPTTTVKFYYDHKSHWVTSNKNSVIAVAVGDFQSELGCPGDWQPDCLRSWLQDTEEDGTYVFTTSALPAGNYNAKVAINESWDENYGAGGNPGGADIPFTVPSNNAPMSFSYNASNYILTISTVAPTATPTPVAGSCTNAAIGDNNVYWVGLGHNSFDSFYRNPTGPVATDQGTVTIKFRTCQNDVSSASIRIWDDLTNTQSILPMSPAGNAIDPTLGNVSYWSVNVSIPTTPTILYYVFRTTDGTNTAHYRARFGDVFYGGAGGTWGGLGGWGDATGNQGEAEGNSFQLTVYDPAYSVPAWMQTGIVYQIFPDRFRDGNPANNPAPGRFFYDEHGAILRSTDPDWNTTICDPRSNSSPCPGIYGQNFYGGDLAGITQKINQGYFDNLGVSVLYLNPIFRSPSNHKYDTADYKVIDPDFGTLADFQAMAAAAHDHGIKIMLDGVFNHTASDSKYFDRYSRYDVAGNLTSPNGPGSNDGSGACEATSSTFRNWFYFSDMFTISNPGRDLPTNTLALCAPVNPPNETRYEAWYGYSSLPKLQANSAQVRDLIWSDGLNSVGPYWTQQGADGWRFDVGADVDQGRTNPGNNDYWEGFRAAVRDSNVTGKTDVVMLGEEWGDSSPWLLGNEWDSVMNYRFRSALLSWLFTGCVDGSNGCSSDARGEKFEENDSNNFSSSGPIGYLSPSQLDTRLRTIQEDYPPMAFKAMMNLEGSHDTQRLRFLLKKGNNDDDTAAIQRMKEWWLF